MIKICILIESVDKSWRRSCAFLEGRRIACKIPHNCNGKRGNIVPLVGPCCVTMYLCGCGVATGLVSVTRIGHQSARVGACARKACTHVYVCVSLHLVRVVRCSSKAVDKSTACTIVNVLLSANDSFIAQNRHRFEFECFKGRST